MTSEMVIVARVPADEVTQALERLLQTDAVVMRGRIATTDDENTWWHDGAYVFTAEDFLDRFLNEPYDRGFHDGSKPKMQATLRQELPPDIAAKRAALQAKPLNLNDNFLVNTCPCGELKAEFDRLRKQKAIIGHRIMRAQGNATDAQSRYLRYKAQYDKTGSATPASVVAELKYAVETCLKEIDAAQKDNEAAQKEMAELQNTIAEHRRKMMLA